MQKIIFLLFGFTMLVHPSQAQVDTIHFNTFGYAENSHINAVPYLKKAIEACKQKRNPILVFPKGRFDFWPQYCEEKMYYESNTDVVPLRKCPIFIHGIKNLTIDFNGAELIFHDRMQPITIDSCENITIKNVSIDWDVPVMGQAQIIKVGTDYIDVSMNEESPFKIENGKIFFIGEGWKSELNDAMEFDKETKFIAQGCGDGCLGNGFYSYKARALSKNVVRIEYEMLRKPKKENYLALRHSARDHAGTFIVNSKNISVENFNMFQNAGLGILSQYTEDLTFKNVQCIPNPKKNRVFAGHDDGLHFSNCKGQITVDHCKFVGLMDDPINVHGTSVKIIEKKNSKTLMCQFMHYQSLGFTWASNGDKIGLIENEALNTFGTATVAAFSRINESEFELTFNEELPDKVEIGDALENLTWAPDVLIKDNFFGSCRARGVLITTPGKVIVENNTFESSGSAILISGDANGWYESGGVQDVLIRNNIFNDACLTSIFQFCEAIISIYPEIPKLNADKPFHRNIRIEHNTFHPFDYPVLYAKSVEGLSFNDNIIQRSKRFAPMHPRKFMITLEACKKVNVQENKLIGNVLGKNIKLILTNKADLQMDNNGGISVE
jgi:hypothetical protein